MSNIPGVTSDPVSATGGLSDMQLRDWFAGQALVGLIPAPKQPGVPALDKPGMAKAAYEYADQMLLARKKQGA